MTADFSWRDLSAAELHIGGSMARHPAGKRIPESPEVRAHRQDLEAVAAANGDLWDAPPRWRRALTTALSMVVFIVGAWLTLCLCILCGQGLGGLP